MRCARMRPRVTRRAREICSAIRISRAPTARSPRRPRRVLRSDIARTIDAYFRRIGGCCRSRTSRRTGANGLTRWSVPTACRCLRDGCNTQGWRPSDAQHPGEFRSALDGLPIRESIHTQAERSDWPTDRARHYADRFLGRADRMAEFQGLRSRAAKLIRGSGSRDAVRDDTPDRGDTTYLTVPTRAG